MTRFLTDPEPFELLGPLPTGTTLLEASAGTGKTFTIATLAVRYVAEEGAPLAELMLVTFGRAATSELRDRVRDRIATAERGLRDADAAASRDPLVAHLAACDAAELAARRERLAAAVADFDAATIATTHGFCQQMLTSLGVAGDVDADAVLLPDTADLVDEVVDDVYLRLWSATADPAITVAQAREAARAAAGDPQALLEPRSAADGSVAGHLVTFAREVCAELDRRKRARRLLDYDDLLVLLRDALTDPVTGPQAVDRVRSRYRVVLVDEFQDTDPVQWQILRTAFHGHRTLVLIGDPKQAIYAFRGGDVVTYLRAAEDAGHTATLTTNWRSDAAVLHGLEHVLRGAALGDERIAVASVDAAQRPGQPERRFDGGAPVRVRQLTRGLLGVGRTRNPGVKDVRAAIAADVAADVVAQLGASRLWDEALGGWRPLRPADVAVLARRNDDAHTVRAALVDAGVPAVVSGQLSVFGTPAARDWLTLLTALEQPGSRGRAAALALTPFVGWTANVLAAATEDDRDDLADRVRRWAGLLARRGVAGLFEASGADGLARRLLGTDAGERRLTDLRHIAQALHLAAVTERLGTSALTDWLRRRIDEASSDYAEERSRRLETDAAAVQVVTVHASKGLEFPVVYVPFAWDRHEPDDPPRVMRFHDDAGRRILHVGAGDRTVPAAWRRHLAEEHGEDLRLLYVALTRAAVQVVLHWAPSKNSRTGPLTRVLLTDYAPRTVPPESVSSWADDDVADALARLAARSGGSVAVETVTAAAPVRWAPQDGDGAPLGLAVLARPLDLRWRRTSYTALTAAAHGGPVPGVATEPETAATDDEADVLADDAGAAAAGGVAAQPDPRVEAGRDLPSPMSDLPGGTAFGTLVHEVLETVDPTAADLRAEVAARCEAAGASRAAGVDAGTLVDGLLAVLDTPLGELARGVRLADVAPRDRLPELEFELPLGGGDDPVARPATLGDVADLLRAHLPADDPFAAYPDLLAEPDLAATHLSGYLTGSLDAVLRTGSGEDVRYLVVDYKTNRLAPPDEAVTAWTYRPEAMTRAMLAAHYPLQLLLYCVALHRFLRWRQPGYDPDRHLGGGLYLFVRGMCGPRTPVTDGTVHGVLAWRPPSGLVPALSALLAHGPSAARTPGGGR